MTTTSLPMRLAHFYRGSQRIFIRLQRAHDFQQVHLVHRIEKMHADASFGAVGNAGDFGHAQRRSVRSEDRGRTTDFVQQGEDLDLRFHLLGDGFDDEIGLARSLFDRARIFQSLECGVGIGGRHFTQFHRFIQVGANFRLGFAQSIGQEIFEDGAIAANGSGMGDTASHDAGADDGDRLNWWHLLVRLVEVGDN